MYMYKMFLSASAPHNACTDSASVAPRVTVAKTTEYRARLRGELDRVEKEIKSLEKLMT